MSKIFIRIKTGSRMGSGESYNESLGSTKGKAFLSDVEDHQLQEISLQLGTYTTLTDMKTVDLSPVIDALEISNT